METAFCKTCQENHELTKEFWYFSGNKKQCRKTKEKNRNKYFIENKEKILTKQREAYHLSPDKFKTKRENSSEKQKAYMAIYRQENIDKIRKVGEKWRRSQGIKPKSDGSRKTFTERYKADTQFKIKVNVRNRLRGALKNKSKVGSAVALLGGAENAIKHLESKFYPHPVTGEAMTWDNHSKTGWNIDHITPLASFDLENLDDLAKACHYSNLQPLWWKENKQKSDKVAITVDVPQFLSKTGVCWKKKNENEFLLSINDKTLLMRLISLKKELEPQPFEYKQKNPFSVQFFETEIANQETIVLSMIGNFFGMSERVWARDCEIAPMTPAAARVFMVSNHLMGYNPSAKYFGLFKENVALSVIGYKKKEDGIEISRFATRTGTNVVGGFSKLLSFLSKKVQILLADKLTQIKPKHITSFCDMRYSSGNSYVSTGFSVVSESVGFVWSDGFKIYNRLYCRANMDARELSERQHADELNLFKIFDAGQRKYKKVIT